MPNARRSFTSASATSYTPLRCRRSDRPQAWREPAHSLLIETTTKGKGKGKGEGEGEGERERFPFPFPSPFRFRFLSPPPDLPSPLVRVESAHVPGRQDRPAPPSHSLPQHLRPLRVARRRRPVPPRHPLPLSLRQMVRLEMG